MGSTYWHTFNSFCGCYGSISAVSFLINGYSESVTAANNNNINNLLLYAVKNASKEVTLYFYGQYPELSLHCDDSIGMTQLHY